MVERGGTGSIVALMVGMRRSRREAEVEIIAKRWTRPLKISAIYKARILTTMGLHSGVNAALVKEQYSPCLAHVSPPSV